jgi:uncharacterized membrane protein YkgB
MAQHAVDDGVAHLAIDLDAEILAAYQAEAIRRWVADSPFLSWIYHIASVQRGAEIIGSIEIVTAALIAMRRWLPKATAIGSVLAAGTLMPRAF